MGSTFPINAGAAHQSRLAAFGSVLLTIGLVFYLVYRPATAFGRVCPDWHLPMPHFTGATLLFGSLPTFLHVVAFCLISSAVLGSRRAMVLIICGGWAVAEIVFELLQQPAGFLAGTFDTADISAALVGAAFAAKLLISTRKLR